MFAIARNANTSTEHIFSDEMVNEPANIFYSGVLRVVKHEMS